MKRVPVAITYVMLDNYDYRPHTAFKSLEFTSRSSKSDIERQISRYIHFVSVTNKWVVSGYSIGKIQENLSGAPLQENFKLKSQPDTRFRVSKLLLVFGGMISCGLAGTVLWYWPVISAFFERTKSQITTTWGQAVALWEMLNKSWGCAAITGLVLLLILLAALGLHKWANR